MHITVVSYLEFIDIMSSALGSYEDTERHTVTLAGLSFSLLSLAFLTSTERII